MANDTLGREQKVWVAAESTFATLPGSTSVDPFVAADAIKVITATADASPERVIRNDCKGDNTNDELIELRTVGSWKAAGYLLGGGAASTAPDEDVILKNAWGSSGAGTGTYDFNLTTGQTSSFSMHLDNSTNRNHGKTAVGCVTEELKISGDGTGAIMWEASGPCANVYDQSRVTANDAMSAGDTDVTVINAEGIQAGAVMAVASQAGEQLLVTDVNTTTNTLTCTRGYGTTSASTIASGDVLVPWSPSSQTFVGTSPVPGTLGSLTIDSTTYKVKSWAFTIKNNIDFQNDHYGTNVADGFEYPNFRDVTFEFTMRLRRDQIQAIIGAGKNAKVHDLALTIGNTAGSQWTLDMPRCKMVGMPAIEYPERDVVEVTASYLCTHTTANSEATMQQS